MIKKIKQAVRFEDIAGANQFIEDNKIPYDEVLVLFDNFIDEKEQEAKAEAGQEVKAGGISQTQDDIIKILIAENEKLKKDGVLPNPTKPTFNPFKKKAPKIINIGEVREQ